jgi:hypothetical protein
MKKINGTFEIDIIMNFGYMIKNVTKFVTINGVKLIQSVSI